MTVGAAALMAVLFFGSVARASSPDAGRPAKIDLELRAPPLTEAPRPLARRDPRGAAEHQLIVGGDEISASSRVRRRLSLRGNRLRRRASRPTAR